MEEYSIAKVNPCTHALKRHQLIINLQFKHHLYSVSMIMIGTFNSAAKKASERKLSFILLADCKEVERSTRKNYKVTSSKQQSMKIENVVLGLLVLMFAAILFVDAILVTYGGSGIPLSANDVKGITGFAFILTAILILLKAREK